MQAIIKDAETRQLESASDAMRAAVTDARTVSDAVKGARIQYALLLAGRLNTGSVNEKQSAHMQALCGQLIANKQLPYSLEVVRAADMKTSKDFAMQLKKRDGGEFAAAQEDDLDPGAVAQSAKGNKGKGKAKK